MDFLETVGNNNAKREKYPEDLFDSRADEQGYLRDIFYVEIDRVAKEKYIYDSLREVVYKKLGASVGFYTMYSYQYGCKQRLEVMIAMSNLKYQQLTLIKKSLSKKAYYWFFVILL